MPQPIQLRYSVNSALLGIALPLVFIAITFNNLCYSYLNQNNINWMLIAGADLLLLSYMAFVVIKRLIPALQGQVALELNEKGINDYVHNIAIEWSYVKDLELEYGRNAAKLIVDLKHETEYGTQVVIRLRWVKGKDSEIFDEAYTYFEEVKGLN